MPKRRRRELFILAAASVAVSTLAYGAWLSVQALSIRDHLTAARGNLEALESQMIRGDLRPTSAGLNQLQVDSDAAKDAASNPGWKLAGALPQIGANFTAITELSISVDDIIDRAVVPLVSDAELLRFEALAPVDGAVNLDELERGAPKLIAAAHVVELSHERLVNIDTSALVSQISAPLTQTTKHLAILSQNLEAAASAAKLAPTMLGTEGRRSYLLLVQNNAESRATGGIPGALAVLTVDNGKFELDEQTTAGALGQFLPPITTDPQQEQIYSTRLGRYMQDVNLTPDFPTAALTAQAMWEKSSGGRLDGVLSVDPVALSYLLDATGPISLSRPELDSLITGDLPTQLNGENVVTTLLSDVYAQIEDPELQDAYFAGVAEETFKGLLSGNADPSAILQSLTRATAEGRIRLWSAVPSEQSLIARYPLSGSVTGPNVLPSEFGVYFNDGTGAKMDYYVKRTAQLIKECPKDGYEETTVRITSTNTAPSDAAYALPKYVTGDGKFGVPPGWVQTNIIAYGPFQAHVETAKLDGQKAAFAPHLHSNRPVGILALQLAPGESRTVDFTFSKIVQHTEPRIVVTPTLDAIREVILPTENAVCN